MRFSPGLTLRLLFSVMLLLMVAYARADEKRYVVPVEDSPTCGPSNAPITIIEFLDYQ